MTSCLGLRNKRVVFEEEFFREVFVQGILQCPLQSVASSGSIHQPFSNSCWEACGEYTGILRARLREWRDLGIVRYAEQQALGITTTCSPCPRP